MNIPKINTTDHAAIIANASRTLDGEIKKAEANRDEAMAQCLECDESEKRQAEERVSMASGVVLGLLLAKSLNS